MKLEVFELKNKDFLSIMDKATIRFVKGRIELKDKETHLCKCYVEAILEFTKQKELIIENGQILKKPK